VGDFFGVEWCETSRWGWDERFFGANVSIVWIKPANGARQSVGQLTVDDNLEGRLETVTAHRAFALTVTPEPNAQVSKPSSKPVFSANVAVSD
jgi:hypothetical protein